MVTVFSSLLSSIFALAFKPFSGLFGLKIVHEQQNVPQLLDLMCVSTSNLSLTKWMLNSWKKFLFCCTSLGYLYYTGSVIKTFKV